MSLFIKHRARTFECDKFDKMKADCIMKYMQESATHQMSEEGLAYDALLDRGVALLINRMDIEFDEQINKFDEIVFESWPCKEKGATLPRKYKVARDGKQIAFALGQWSMVDVSTMKIMRPGAVDFSCFTIEEGCELSCERFKLPEGLEHLADIKVGYNDVDCNGHLNNTNYLRIVQDYMPELEEGRWIRKAQIHFSKEAPLGSRLRLLGKREVNDGKVLYYFKSIIAGKGTHSKDEAKGSEKSDEINAKGAETVNCEIKIELNME